MMAGYNETVEGLKEAEHVTVAEIASDNLVILLQYLAEAPAYSKDDLAYAAEKPWKYDPELGRALAARAAEAE